VRSCLIDGEAVACDGDGLPSFDRVRYRRQDGAVFLYAFDLLELDGWDLRREPIEVRKRELATLLRSARLGLQLNEHIAESDDVVFRHACKLGFEGIVSKRLGSRYTSGRTRNWLKMKNPAGPAVKREAEEGWETLEMTTRTHFSFRVDTWTPDGESIVESPASKITKLPPLPSARPAKRRPGTPTQGARVIEDRRRLRLA